MSAPAETAAAPPSGVPAWAVNLWAVVAAFGTYFCMYMYRKPFTAAAYADGWQDWDQKKVLVAAQIVGYLISKLIGIRVVSEVGRGRRAALILLLILCAHAALLLFAVVPPPWHVFCLFLNGLPLGIVFGLVLGCLEGRRMSEALTAGLCASFILAGGVSKTVGRWVLDVAEGSWGWGVVEAERWMPFLAGGLFLVPTALFVWMLGRVPPPDAHDESARSRREPMRAEDRGRIVRAYAGGLAAICVMYLMVTILRSLRDDFAPEILRGLGGSGQPAAYATIDFWVALIVMLVNGASVLIRDNRVALQAALGICATGFALTLATVGLQAVRPLPAELLMILVGAGLYLPYVAVHTTIFERLIAFTRDRANVGFLMYLADTLGYFGYAALMLLGNLLPKSAAAGGGMVAWFLSGCTAASVVSLVLLLAASLRFARLGRAERPRSDAAAD